MRVIGSTLLVLLLTCPAHAGRFRAIIAAKIGLASVKRHDTPSPAPAPKVPRSECADCNGTGVIGDGTIELPCTNCYEAETTARKRLRKVSAWQTRWQHRGSRKYIRRPVRQSLPCRT